MNHCNGLQAGKRPEHWNRCLYALNLNPLVSRWETTTVPAPDVTSSLRNGSIYTSALTSRRVRTIPNQRSLSSKSYCSNNLIRSHFTFFKLRQAGFFQAIVIYLFSCSLNVIRVLNKVWFVVNSPGSINLLNRFILSLCLKHGFIYSLSNPTYMKFVWLKLQLNLFESPMLRREYCGLWL